MTSITNIYELLGEDGEEVKQLQPTPAKKPPTQNKSQQAPNKGKQPIVPVPPKESTKENHARNKREDAGKKDFAKKAKEVVPSGTKRQFDKHSGTGRPKNENKKGGSGKGNWGGPLDEQTEVKVDPQVVATEPKEQVPQEGQQQPQQGQQQPQEGQQHTQPEQEEEDKTVTLGEYKKKLQKKTST